MFSDACPTLKDHIGVLGFSLRQERCPDGTVRSFVVLQANRAGGDPNASPDADADRNEQTRTRVRTEDMQSVFGCP
jgi:hypothetical protein